MIISCTNAGEVDKRVSMLTKENGKISAFAKGAKRPTSQLLAACNPFVFGEFELYVGRSAYTLVKANVKNYFNEIQSDLESVYYGSYLLELADYFTKENNDEVEVLKLLYQSVKALCYPKIDNRLVRAIYEMKILVINGLFPSCFECKTCGNKNDIIGFSFMNNGVICSDCYSSVSDFMELDSSAIYALQYIISTPSAKLFNFTVTNKVLEDMNMVITHYFRRNLDRRLKSEEFLNDILENPF